MNLYTRRLLCLTAVCGSVAARGQEIPFKQFTATPLLLNPAFTGMFDGNIRANLIYRNFWAAANVPISSIHGSADAPVYTDKKGNYFGAGGAFSETKPGDDSWSVLNGQVSASYHRRFGSDSARKKGKGSDLAIGIQGGYAQNGVDVSRMYFTGASTTPTYVLGAGNSVSIYSVNAGVSYSRSVNKHFGYQVGLSVTDLNRSQDALLESQKSLVGLNRKLMVTAGCHIAAGEHLQLRPAFIYARRESFGRNKPYVSYIAGNEFLYTLGVQTALFCGLWYSRGDMMTINAGIRTRGVRVGVGYDYTVSSFNTASNGTGGFEVALTYINPSARAVRRYVPCARF
ncbi:MAG: PorP/SprF family type IX secretion system membrane protein [Flavipsychrobacter sp.]|nr:PorP/SprF family type IX secretion system membrane protein [Flavipsychrobacter sp.]